MRSRKAWHLMMILILAILLTAACGPASGPLPEGGEEGEVTKISEITEDNLGEEITISGVATFVAVLLDVVCLDFEDESGCIKVCIDREVIEAMPEEEADKIEAGTKMKLTGILKKRGDYALLVTEPSSVEIQGE